MGGIVEPELLIRAVTRLEEVNVSYTVKTEEQKSILREARNSCRIIGQDSEG